MYHFFIKPEQAAAHEVAIIGSDVNHIKNVLRMKVGEQICVNDGSHEYLCSIAQQKSSRSVKLQVSCLQE